MGHHHTINGKTHYFDWAILNGKFLVIARGHIPLSSHYHPIIISFSTTMNHYEPLFFHRKILRHDQSLRISHMSHEKSHGKTHLVGGWATPLKNMKVNWDDELPNIWENKTCSKPPTRLKIEI